MLPAQIINNGTRLFLTIVCSSSSYTSKLHVQGGETNILDAII